MFIYFDSTKTKDKRSNKELREELNYSQLGILGYNFKESKRYIEQDKRYFTKP